jgi:hypothetical protein
MLSSAAILWSRPPPPHTHSLTGVSTNNNPDAQVTYGYDARNAQLIGVQKGLAEADISLAAYEGITKVELKESKTNK